LFLDKAPFFFEDRLLAEGPSPAVIGVGRRLICCGERCRER